MGSNSPMRPGESTSVNKSLKSVGVIIETAATNSKGGECSPLS